MVWSPTDWISHARDAWGFWLAKHFCSQPFRGFRRRLVSYVFSDLEANERQEIEFHLNQCYRCDVEVRWLQTVKENFREIGELHAARLRDGESSSAASAERILADLYAYEQRLSGNSPQDSLEGEHHRIEELPGGVMPEDRLRRRARSWPVGGSPRWAAGIAAGVVAIVAAAFWSGVHVGGRTGASGDELRDRLLLHSGAALASRLILEEPLLDVRTSFGPEIPAVAMLFREGFSLPDNPDAAETVEALLRSEIEAGTTNARIPATAAVIAAFQRNNTDARKMMTRALALASSSDGATFLDAGVVALLLSDFETAESCFSRALAADPALAEAQYNLARLYEITGSPQATGRAWAAYTGMDSVSLWADLAGARRLEPEDRTRGGDWPPWNNPPGGESH